MDKKHSEETKRKLSEIRKKYLAENPDKHVWKRHSKFKSAPCEHLKLLLRNRAILFIEEYTVDGTNYSIDIAFPDKKIGLEINGNQHYERNGNLKSYYIEREKRIEEKGWRLYQVHYSCCFNETIIVPIVEKVISSDIKESFDYLNYQPRSKKKTTTNPNWRREPKLNQRKVARPSKEELSKLIWEKPTTQVAKEFGVSDVAIAKWCKLYNISKPPRGYWEKLYHCI